MSSLASLTDQELRDLTEEDRRALAYADTGDWSEGQLLEEYVKQRLRAETFLRRAAANDELAQARRVERDRHRTDLLALRKVTLSAIRLMEDVLAEGSHSNSAAVRYWLTQADNVLSTASFSFPGVPNARDLLETTTYQRDLARSERDRARLERDRAEALLQSHEEDMLHVSVKNDVIFNLTDQLDNAKALLKKHGLTIDEHVCGEGECDGC